MSFVFEQKVGKSSHWLGFCSVSLFKTGVIFE